MKILISLSAKSNKQTIVLDEGSGKVINKLYDKWHNIKTPVQQQKWVESIRKTTFGTYETLPLLEVLKTFEPKYPNEIVGKAFVDEIKKALR